MKSILILLIGILFLPMLASAQKDYETGYIITNNNDTIMGLVKDRKQPPFGKLYKKVFFRNKHTKKKYSPTQIKGYKQGYREFESMWIDVSSHLINEKYTSAPNRGEKEFLKVIYRGYLTYYHREFADPDSDYIDYINLFKRGNEDYLVRVTQGIFGLKKGSLSVYFSDCEKLVLKINNEEIKTPVEIAKYYNSRCLKK